MHALISVSDKTGVVELARELAALGVELLSTGGTAKLLADAGLAVTEVAEHTGFPEMLDGRVKTLHPTIHGGLLARRDRAEHMAAMRAARHRARSTCWSSTSIRSRRRSRKAGCTLDDAIENIDIGGPAMVRSAAKNWKRRRRRSPTRRSTPASLAELKARRRGQRARPASRSRSPPSTASPTTTPRSATTCRRSPARATASRARASSRRRRTAASSSCRTCATARTRTSARPSIATSQPAPGSLVTAQAAAGQGALVQQHRRRRCGVGMRQELRRRAGVRDRQARQPVRRRDRRRRAEALREGVQDRSDLGLRRHHRLQPRGRRRRAELVAKQFVEVLIAPSYSAEALAVFAAKANMRVLQIAAARRRRRRPQRARPQARRLGPADPDRRQPRRRRARPEGRDDDASRRRRRLRDLLFAWKVAQVREEQRDRLLRRRHDARRRRRPDEPRRLGADRRRSRPRTPASRWPARRWRATRSSRSATASTSSSTPARPA